MTSSQVSAGDAAKAESMAGSGGQRRCVNAQFSRVCTPRQPKMVPGPVGPCWRCGVLGQLQGQQQTISFVSMCG